MIPVGRVNLVNLYVKVNGIWPVQWLLWKRFGLRVVGAHVPVSKVRGSSREGRSLFMSLLAGVVAVIGGQPGKASEGTGVRGYVRTLNLARVPRFATFASGGR